MPDPTSHTYVTAVLRQASGFGEAFGAAFGGWRTTVTATLASGGAVTAELAPAAATAVLAAAPVATAELQLV